MAGFPNLYCTDEDILDLVKGDFAGLLPEAQCMASGSDGVFLSSDRWTLTVASTPDFGDRGLAAGHVVLFEELNPRIKNDALVVVSADGPNCLLRRAGLTPGLGEPPAPAAGASAVNYTCKTALPQITQAVFDLNRRYRIGSSVQLLSFSDFRRATALWTARDLYFGQYRSFGIGEGSDVLKKKATDMERMLADELAVLDQTYGPNKPGRRIRSSPMVDSTDWRVPRNF